MLKSNLEEVLALLDDFVDYSIYHIYREGNQIEDSLENLGADGDNLVIINDLSPLLEL